jgi:transposase
MAKRLEYDKSFKEEAVKLAGETSINKAAQSLGIHVNTLRNWIQSSRERPDNPFIGSGHKYIPNQDAEKVALLKKIQELERANEILKEALGFFAVSQKK